MRTASEPKKDMFELTDLMNCNQLNRNCMYILVKTVQVSVLLKHIFINFLQINFGKTILVHIASTVMILSLIFKKRMLNIFNGLQLIAANS